LPLVLLSCHEVVEVLRAGAGGAASDGGVAGALPNSGAAGGGTAGNAGAGGHTALPDPSLADSLSAGQVHTCLARAGLVYCWGDNTDGQLGTGDQLRRELPALVPGSEGVVQVVTGEQHTCWLTRDGVVSCFGSNALGQLGHPGPAEQLVPVPVALPARATALDAGYGHSCAVLETHELYCWGENVETQLGQGDAPDENHPEPVLVPLPDEARGVACGQGHTLAFTTSGVFAWGRNTTSECGLGEGQPTRLRSPTQLPGLSGVAALDAGQSSACALMLDGSLQCWGAGADQHLGTGSDATVWSPRAVAPGFAWTTVTLDTFHTCSIDSAARLYCWGRSIEGQLGLGNNDRLTPEPTLVAGGPWRAVSVGRFHTCAISSDGRLWCTGANAEGELGLGDLARRNVFTELRLP
jgi:alpha-tubulin suppressor-like RCC1 family protein